jgi:hypothetical protein
MASVGRKRSAKESDAVELADPLAVRHIALAPGYILQVARIDEQDLEPACLEEFVDGDPVDACGLHRDARDTACGEPLRQPPQIAREGLERLHRVAVAIRRHGHEMLRGAAVNARDIRIDALQHGRRHAPCARDSGTIVFHRTLLHTPQEHPGTGQRRSEQSPKRDHVRATVRVTSDAAATPRATLTYGLTSTSAGSASVPGCARDCTRESRDSVCSAQFLS